MTSSPPGQSAARLQDSVWTVWLDFLFFKTLWMSQTVEAVSVYRLTLCINGSGEMNGRTAGIYLLWFFLFFVVVFILCCCCCCFFSRSGPTGTESRLQCACLKCDETFMLCRTDAERELHVSDVQRFTLSDH